MARVKDKVALVTGGVRGLGLTGTAVEVAA